MRQRLYSSENRKWWTLGAVAVGLFMIMLDNTVVNVAVPSIQRDLGVGLSELQWIVTGYALSFAALMLTGGKLADMFGRRRIFVTGIVIFTIASLFCGLADTGQSLIGWRIVQGVGAALMNPATLAIISATFPPRQRGMAIGIWAGVSALALAIGPLVGGLLTEHLSWSWVFFVNVPVGVLGRRGELPADRRVARHVGGATARPRGPGHLGARPLRAHVRADRGEHYGWSRPGSSGRSSWRPCSSHPSSLLELRQRVPMLDLTLFRNGTFAGANVVILMVGLAMFGVFFFVSLYMQNILGFSAVQAGAAFLPMTC